MVFFNPTGPFCIHGRCSICPTAMDRKTDWKCCQGSEWVCKDRSIKTFQTIYGNCKEQILETNFIHIYVLNYIFLSSKILSVPLYIIS